MLGYRAMGGFGGWQGGGGVASGAVFNMTRYLRWGAYFSRAFGIVGTRILPPYQV